MRWSSWALGLAAPLLLIAAACGRADAPAASPAAAFRVLWAGDTLLADAAQPLLDRLGYGAPFAELTAALAADYTVVNLEGPLTTRTERWDDRQTWSYHAQPAAAAALAEAGVDAAGLANNHALDRGPAGLADTLAALAEAGIAGFGAGRDREHAAAPLLIETPYGRIAVVGFGEDEGAPRMAGDQQAGTLAPTYTALQRARDLARKADARWLVAFVHWGTNYRGVEAEQRRWAHRFVDAGFDLVVGHGPHVAQRLELIGGVPVFYSLGNFVFGTPGRYGANAPGRSLLLTTEFGSGGLTAVTLRCLLTDNDEVRFQPRLCPEEMAAEALSTLHADVEVTAGVGRLALGSRR